MKGKEYPFHTRDELTKQIPSLKKDYLSYTKFAEATLVDLFGKKALDTAAVFEAYQMQSVVVKNLGNYHCEIDTFPLLIQSSPIKTGYFLSKNKYLLLGGNFYPVNVQLGRYDASWESLLEYQPDNKKFSLIAPIASGLSIKGETRKIIPIQINGETHAIFIKNNQKPEVVKFK